MRWQERDALDRDAEQRLRQVLHRQPSAEEILQLRHGEQALGLEDPALAKARQLTARARALRDLNRQLVTELRASRKEARHTRFRAEKKRHQHS